jgi:hypothetical protein
MPEIHVDVDREAPTIPQPEFKDDTADRAQNQKRRCASGVDPAAWIMEYRVDRAPCAGKHQHSQPHGMPSFVFVTHPRPVVRSVGHCNRLYTRTLLYSQSRLQPLKDEQINLLVRRLISVRLLLAEAK